MRKQPTAAVDSARWSEEDAPVHPLNKLVKDKGITVAEIARRANVSAVVLYQVTTRIRNRPGLDTIMALVAAFPELDESALGKWKWPRLRKKSKRKTFGLRK